jgi:hypothetical protein
MKILYKNDDGSTTLIIPVLDSGLTIEEIARKDVPAGKNYWFVEDDEALQMYGVFGDSFIIDETNPPDGQGIGADAWFAEREDNA